VQYAIVCSFSRSIGLPWLSGAQWGGWPAGHWLPEGSQGTRGLS
jgi:hypothetical protein